MTSRKTAIAITFALTSAGLVVALVPGGVARAAETSDVQDLRREVKQLKAEVNALQVVLAETTELERQRSANLTRAVKAMDAPTPPPAAPAASADDAPLAPTAAAAPAPATPPAAHEGKARGASHKRHNKRSPRTRSRDR